jgi:acetyltransferase-like isoleucine patch superfamily enzyme
VKEIIFKLLSYLAKNQHAKVASVGSSVFFGPFSKINNKNSREHIKFGNNISFYGKIINLENGTVVIGDNTTVRYNTIIECVNQVVIGKNVIISNNIIITDNDSHPVSFRQRENLSLTNHEGEEWSWNNAKNSPVFIQDNVWIGRNCMILKGVNIGKGSVIAAGTVLTKSVPPYSLCFGNPCVIKEGKYLE